MSANNPVPPDTVQNKMEFENAQQYNDFIPL